MKWIYFLMFINFILNKLNNYIFNKSLGKENELNIIVFLFYYNIVFCKFLIDWMNNIVFIWFINIYVIYKLFELFEIF